MHTNYVVLYRKKEKLKHRFRFALFIDKILVNQMNRGNTLQEELEAFR